MTKECAICDVCITDINDTNEHVLPNAIGGRKKIKGFICRSCNSKSGENWDAELAKQFNSFSLFFNINRERGDVPSQILNTIGGESYRVHPEGSMSITKPVLEERQIENGVEINLSARDMREARQMLNGLKKKYPQIDPELVLKNAQPVSRYLDDYLHVSSGFGGHDVGRSLVKSALAIAVNAGVLAKSCENARNYLITEDTAACFGYYYERDLILNRPDGVVFHCVAVKGNPETKLLLGYVELFGFFRVVICLSENYSGLELHNSYSIDPISGKELGLNLDMSLSHDEIKAAYRYEKIPEGAIKAAMDRVMPLAMAAAFEKEKDRVLTAAVEYAFANCGVAEGEIIPPDKAKLLTGLIMEKLMPFLIRHIAQPKNGIETGFTSEDSKSKS